MKLRYKPDSVCGIHITPPGVCARIVTFVRPAIHHPPPTLDAAVPSAQPPEKSVGDVSEYAPFARIKTSPGEGPPELDCWMALLNSAVGLGNVVVFATTRALIRSNSPNTSAAEGGIPPTARNKSLMNIRYRLSTYRYRPICSTNQHFLGESLEGIGRFRAVRLVEILFTLLLFFNW